MQHAPYIIEEDAPQKDTLVAFCDCIGDDNQIHRCNKRAQAMGLPAEPIAGTWLAARAIHHVFSIRDSPTPMSSLAIEFKRPVFIGDPIKWEITPNVGHYTIIARNIRDKTVCEAAARKDIEISQPSGNAIRPYTLKIDPEHHQIFRETTGITDARATAIHIAQMAPSILLRLLRDVNNRNSAGIVGLNAGMRQQFEYRPQMPSTIEGKIVKFEEMEKKGKRWNFPFGVSLYDEGQPVGSVEIRCNTNGWLDTSPFYI